MKISLKDENYYNTVNACKDNGLSGVEYVRTLIDKSFENGVESCQKLYEEKLRWIPIEEKLPEPNSKVLAKGINEHIEVVFFQEIQFSTFHNLRYITHWRYFL